MQSFVLGHYGDVATLNALVLLKGFLLICLANGFTDYLRCGHVLAVAI